MTLLAKKMCSKWQGNPALHPKKVSADALCVLSRNVQRCTPPKQELFSKAVYMCVPVDSERESRLDRRIGPNKGYVHGISFGAAAYAAGERSKSIRKWAQKVR